MKYIIIIVFTLSSLFSYSQDRYFTKTGHIDFYSHAPLEDIRSNNDQVAAFLYTNTGEISFGVLINSFEFEKALMQRHFNENYMESDKYPKAVFKGQIQEWDKVDMTKKGKVEVVVKGQLVIRNIRKEVEAKATLDITDKKIIAASSFIAKPSDFDITIPQAVINNIAKEIEVNIRVELVPN